MPSSEWRFEVQAGWKALKQPAHSGSRISPSLRRGRLVGLWIVGRSKGRDSLAKKVSLITDRPLDRISMLSGN